jgi:hypothetical protein
MKMCLVIAALDSRVKRQKRDGEDCVGSKLRRGSVRELSYLGRDRLIMEDKIYRVVTSLIYRL